MADSTDALKALDAFVGEWNVAGTMTLDEPMEISGWTGYEWIEGDGYRMHYFDSRGVSRIYEMTLDGRSWTLERAPSGPRSDFWQRWIGEFSEDGNTIKGRWENSGNGSDWEIDFHLMYTRI